MLAEDNKTQKMHSGAENFDKFQFLFNTGFLLPVQPQHAAKK